MFLPWSTQSLHFSQRYTVSWFWYEFVPPQGAGRRGLRQRCAPEPPGPGLCCAGGSTSAKCLEGALPRCQVPALTSWGRSPWCPFSFTLPPKWNAERRGLLLCFHHFLFSYFSETSVRRCGCYVKGWRALCQQPVRSLWLVSLFQLMKCGSGGWWLAHSSASNCSWCPSARVVAGWHTQGCWEGDSLTWRKLNSLRASLHRAQLCKCSWLERAGRWETRKMDIVASSKKAKGGHRRCPGVRQSSPLVSVSSIYCSVQPVALELMRNCSF